MKKIGWYIFVVLFSMVFFSENSLGQNSKYSLNAGYLYSPTILSYGLIYRSDHGSEPFKVEKIQGFGVGYSIRVFRFFSPELSFIQYSIMGIDDHIEDEVKFEGVQLRLGGALHIHSKNPELNMNFGYIKVESRFERQQEDGIKIERNGDGGGLYLGPSIIVKINNTHALKFSAYGVLMGSGFDTPSSFDLGWMLTVHSELSISYVFRF